jgi:hypothetical protein
MSSTTNTINPDSKFQHAQPDGRGGYTITPIADPVAFHKKHEDEHEGKELELSNWAKLMRGRPDRMDAMTFVGVSQHDKDNNMAVIQQGLHLIFHTNMRVNGKKNNWNCGFLGSRWFDYEFAGKSVRVAFYSKKYYPTTKVWTHDEPYAITFHIDRS